MTAATLGGAGVLVTRPEHLAGELIDAVTEACGKALPFPVIDIVARAPESIAGELAEMPEPDITIFVSRNAVSCGLDAFRGSGTRIAAIGPSTASALEAAGRQVDIVPQHGFDSEHLLAESAFTDVAGQRICIVRGDGGRELLLQTLRARGATVDCLSAYRREPHRFTDAELDRLAGVWRQDQVRFVTAMSVASLENLLDLLPPACREKLDRARLVTPSERVIQTALARIPRMRSLLSAGPGASHMVATMLTSLRPQTDNAHD